MKSDITESKRTERALQRERDRAQSYLDLAGVMFVAINRAGEITLINRKACEVLGYGETEIVGKNWFECFLPERVREEVKLIFQSLLSGEIQTEEYAENLVLTKSGEERIIAWHNTMLRNEEGKITGTLSSGEDITERKQAEEALRVREKQYRTLFEDSKDAVYIATREGNYIDVNRAFLDLYGYTREEISNLSSLKVWVNPEDRSRFLMKLEKDGSIKEFEAKVRRKDGTEIDCLLTSTALRDDDGMVIGSQGIVRDVTEIKRSQQELNRTLECLRDSMRGTIQAMALTVERRDPCTAGHQQRVADLARAIAQEMRLPKNQVDGIRLAGMIHDLGKISVPADILSKPSRLTEHEFALIKTHPQVGHDILKGIEFPWPIAQITLQHHERMDGSGYPQGLSGEDILVEAKILAVADVVEAMVSHRPYRPAFSLDKALEEIAQKRGTLYDPDVVDACLKVFGENGFKFRQF